MDNVIDFEKFKKSKNLTGEVKKTLDQLTEINGSMVLICESLLATDYTAYNSLIAMQILINRTATEIGADPDQIKMDAIYFDIIWNRL